MAPRKKPAKKAVKPRKRKASAERASAQNSVVAAVELEIVSKFGELDAAAVAAVRSLAARLDCVAPSAEPSAAVVAMFRELRLTMERLVKPPSEAESLESCPVCGK